MILELIFYLQLFKFSNFDAVVSDRIWPTHEKVSSINADSNASLTGNVQLVAVAVLLFLKGMVELLQFLLQKPMQ